MRAGGDVDVAALEHAAGHIRGVVVACPQALEGGVLVAEGSQEGEREFRSVEGLKGQFREGGFDFYCVHGEAGFPLWVGSMSNDGDGPTFARLASTQSAIGHITNNPGYTGQ